MDKLKEVNAILASKKKFRRALIVLLLCLSVLVYGIASGEMTKMVVAIFAEDKK